MAGSNPLADTDARALRLIARRTWRFFETFVTANDHMLPPDNFQEEPQPVLAHRTSPTNLGLYLLSVVAACDFGWLGKIETAERMEATLGTMNGLERFRGHFYNWYDTHDLRPLEPKYISSVDSGNLAGSPDRARKRLPGDRGRARDRAANGSLGSTTRWKSRASPCAGSRMIDGP